MERQSGNGFTWYWTPTIWPWNPADGPWKPEHGQPRDSVYLEVSSKAAKPRHAYEYWRKTVFYNFEADPELPGEKRDFQAEAKAFFSPRGNLYTYRSDAISGRRTRKQAMSDSRTSIDIGLVVAGSRYYESDLYAHPDGKQDCKSGSFFVYDPSSPCRVEWQAHQGVNLTLPRDAVIDALGRPLPPAHIFGNELNTSDIAPFLRSQLLLLSRDLSKLTPEDRSLLLDNTIDLLLAAIRSVAGCELVTSTTIRQGLFIAAQRFIENHLADPNLNAEKIAAAIGCSRSTLYRAFAEQNLTVADCVRERRFQLFFHLLHNFPGQATITTLAHQCGFKDSTNFGKAFKRRFGVSPTEARKQKMS